MSWSEQRFIAVFALANFCHSFKDMFSIAFPQLYELQR